MSTIELTMKLKELKEFEALIKQAQDEAEAIKDTIKTVMNQKGVDEMQVDVYTVRNKVVKSNRFDSTAFKATHGELYNQYTKETAACRFTVA